MREKNSITYLPLIQVVVIIIIIIIIIISQILGPKKVKVSVSVVHRINIISLKFSFFSLVIIMLCILHKDWIHERWRQPILYLK